MGARLHDAYVRSGGPRDQRDEHADRAAADHDDPLAIRDVGAAHVVHGHGGGLHEGGPVQGEGGGQADEGVRGDGPALLHRARGIDADEVEVLADVVVARGAGRAGAVPAQGHHGHRVTG